MKRAHLVSLLLLFIFSSKCYPQEHIETGEIFKLGTTPFIYSDTVGVFFSYGINYGSVGMLVDQWVVPNIHEEIFFREHKLGVAI